MKRARRPRVERLEDRLVLTGLVVNFVIDDPGGAFARFPTLRSTLDKAAAVFASYIDGKGSIDVDVKPAILPSNVGANGGPFGYYQAGSDGGRTVFEPGTLREARTGVDPNGSDFDAVINVNTSNFSGDNVGLFLHEMIHGLGLLSARSLAPASYGQLVESEYLFDKYTAYGAGGDPSILDFVGPEAELVHGSPVPLMSVQSGPSADANFSHVGNEAGHPGDDLAGDLMSDVIDRSRAAYNSSTIGPLDLAILNDMGYQVRSTIMVQDGLILDETAGAVSVPITRVGDLSSAATVHFATVDGTARAGVKYVATSGTAQFAAGQAVAMVRIPTLNDSTDGDVDFSLRLDSPTGGEQVVNAVTAPITIRDTTTQISLSESPTATVVENAGSYSVDVFRYSTHNSASTATVHYSTRGGTAKDGVNYRATSGTITFGPGEFKKTILVPVLQDGPNGPDTDFILTLDSPTGTGNVFIQSGTVDVTILDSTTTIGLLNPEATVSEDAGSYSVDVFRSGIDTSGTFTVHYATAGGTAKDGVNYRATSGTLTFGPYETQKIISVPVLQDGLSRPDTDFILTLDSPTGSGDFFISNGSVDVTVLDATTNLHLDSAPTASVTEAAGSYSVDVVRSGRDTTSTFAVQYLASGGTAKEGVNYRGTAGNLFFGPGELRKTITVPILQDGRNGPDTDFILSLRSPGGPGNVIDDPASVDVTIINTYVDWTTKLSLVGPPTARVSEDAGSYSIDVSRSGHDLTGAYAVQYSTGGGTAKAGVNYRAIAGNLFFGPNETHKTLTIPILQDGRPGPDVDFILSLRAPGGPGDVVIQNGAVDVTIANTTVLRRAVGDFDGDGKTDVAVYGYGRLAYRPSSGGPDRVVPFGVAGDRPVVGDFDGDGKADVAVYGNGRLLYRPSSGGADRSISFGGPADQFISGDFDGDGKTDVAVYGYGRLAYRPSSGGPDRFIAFGGPADRPVIGDFDGDGKTDVAVYGYGRLAYRPSSGGPDRFIAFGGPADQFISGDFDGDGKTDVAVYGYGRLAYRPSSGGPDRVMPFGVAGDRPVVGDFDGDGKADVAVYGNGRLLYRPSSGGADRSISFGGPADQFLSAAGPWAGASSAQSARGLASSLARPISPLALIGIGPIPETASKAETVTTPRVQLAVISRARPRPIVLSMGKSASTPSITDMTR